MTERTSSPRAGVGLGRAWLLIVVMTFVAAGVGYAATSRRPPTYRATTSILVGQPFETATVNKDNFEASEQLALAYADVIRRQPVLEGVVDALGLDESWEELRNSVQVDVPSTNPHLILVTVEARSSETATAVAEAVSSQLIALSPTTSESLAAAETQDFVRARLQYLQEDINQTQERIQQLESQLSGGAGPTTELQSRLDDQQTLLVDLQENYASLLQILAAGELPNSLEILERPGAEATAVQPNSLFVALLAGGVGFFLALGLAYLLEFREPEMSTPDSEGATRPLRPASEAVRGDFGAPRKPQGPPAPGYRDQGAGQAGTRPE